MRALSTKLVFSGDGSFSSTHSTRATKDAVNGTWEIANDVLVIDVDTIEVVAHGGEVYSRNYSQFCKSYEFQFAITASADLILRERLGDDPPSILFGRPFVGGFIQFSREDPNQRDVEEAKQALIFLNLSLIHI